MPTAAAERVIDFQLEDTHTFDLPRFAPVRRIIDKVLLEVPSSVKAAEDEDGLRFTQAEYLVLALSALGKTTSDLATHFEESTGEIEHIEKEVAWKLGATNTSASVNRGIQRRLLPIEFEPNPVPTNDDERKIMRLIASGRSNKQVGRYLRMGETRFGKTRSALFHNLGALSRAHAVTQAHRHRLIN